MLCITFRHKPHFSAPVRITIHVCSQCTLSLSFVAEQLEKATSTMTLEGIGWDVEEWLCVLSITSTVAFL